jgi:hypothetical protein
MPSLGSELAQKILSRIPLSPKHYFEFAELRKLNEDVESLNEVLARLLHREIIERVENGFCITVPLVAEYVSRKTLL